MAFGFIGTGWRGVYASGSAGRGFGGSWSRSGVRRARSHSTGRPHGHPPLHVILPGLGSRRRNRSAPSPCGTSNRDHRGDGSMYWRRRLDRSPSCRAACIHQGADDRQRAISPSGPDHFLRVVLDVDGSLLPSPAQGNLSFFMGKCRRVALRRTASACDECRQRRHRRYRCSCYGRRWRGPGPGDLR